MYQPREPRHFDFGITETEEQEAVEAARRFQSRAKYVVVVVCSAALVWGLCYPSVRQSLVSNPLAWVCYGLPMAWFAAVAVFAMVYRVFQKMATRRQPAAIREYWEARSKYSDELEVWRAAERRLKREHWWGLSGWEFEHEVAKHFRQRGYRATVTPGSGDGGVDIELQRGSEAIAVQCKAHARPVGPKDIREFYGVLCSEPLYQRGIFVSKAGFSQSAKSFATGKPIELVTLDDLLSQEASWLNSGIVKK